MIRLVVFDLDDTLFPELAFVASGYRAVARRVAGLLTRPTGQAEADLWELYRAGRERVFDRLLARYGVGDLYAPEELLELYRAHPPQIELHADAAATLAALSGRGQPLALVTDGAALSQRGKVRALGLEDAFARIVYTAELGPGFTKPHPRAFELVLDHFGVAPVAACYVGDNAAKDFLAPNRLGMTSFQIMRPDGVYAGAVPPDGGAPKVKINSLTELLSFIA